MAARSGHEGRIDLNAAQAAELEQIEGIDAQRARLLLEERKKRGAFRSWDEVEAIPGIGETLLHKLQAAATLHEPAVSGRPVSVRQRQPRQGQRQGRAQSQRAVEEPPPAPASPGLMALLALAQMDLEAAEAYRIGAERMQEQEEEIARQLMSFRGDHLRHVDDLERLTSDMGGDLLDRDDTAGSVLAALATAAAELGPFAAFLAMISNERLTNSTYEAALALTWDDDVREILERNREDERRHLTWLEAHRSRLAPEARGGEGDRPSAEP